MGFGPLAEVVPDEAVESVTEIGAAFAAAMDRESKLNIEPSDCNKAEVNREFGVGLPATYGGLWGRRSNGGIVGVGHGEVRWWNKNSYNKKTRGKKNRYYKAGERSMIEKG
jgi:hypothetical protein